MEVNYRKTDDKIPFINSTSSSDTLHRTARAYSKY